MAVGKINIDIYFGTKFDGINVPFNTNLIPNTATKKLSVTGTYVWQTNWIDIIRINTINYDNVVGAQYVKITDKGITPEREYWYTVLGCQNVSRMCVEIGLMYEPLLTIGINNIRGISGFLKRWTVSDDTHFNYINSPEPLNQIDDYNYEYFRYNATNDEESYTFVGFPYDMQKSPRVDQYVNSGGEITPIFYPNLPLGRPTEFLTNRNNGGLNFSDGLTYYEWNLAVEKVRENYALAVGLGLELVSTAYILPKSPHVQLGKGLTWGYSFIEGKELDIATNLSIYTGSYNNNKSSEIGIYFNLYNEASGEDVVIQNYDLSDTTITVGANPYVTGYFYARFKSYYHNTSGKTGLVKSVGYQPYSLATPTGLNQTRNTLNNTIANDNALVNYTNARNTNNATMAGNAITSIGGFAADAVGSSKATDLAQSGIRHGSELTANIIHYVTNYQNLKRSYTQQKAELTVQGNLGNAVPPSFKLNNVMELAENPYDFVVRKTTLSALDRARADKFFTAFGYNVDNLALDSYTQLSNRQRFTFVMADDVTITSLVNNADLMRFKDIATTEEIKNRFSSGLRIWQIEPNYNFTIANPIN